MVPMVYSQYMAGVGLIITIIILKTLSFVTHGVFSQCETMYHKPCPYNLLHTVCEIKNELLTATPNQKHPYCSWKWPWKTQCGTWCKWWNTLEGGGAWPRQQRYSQNRINVCLKGRAIMVGQMPTLLCCTSRLWLWNAVMLSEIDCLVQCEQEKPA